MKQLILAYERVSSDEQGKKGFSISEQQNDIETYAMKRGDIIDRHYVDKGYSGTTMNRKNVKKMLKQVADGNVKKIYIKFANRLSRDDTMVRSLRKVFYKYKVEIVSINEDWAAEDDNADKKLSCDLVSRVDRAEPERAKIRTRAGLMMSAKLGNWCVPTVRLGFKKIPNPNSTVKDSQTIAPIDEWRPTVDKIVKMILDHQYPAQKIADILSGANEQNRVWSAKDVLMIATKPEYSGEFEQSYFKSVNHHEGFYSPETRQEMIKIIHGRRRVKKYVYLFKGIVFCQECGGLLTCIPTVKKRKGKNNVMTKTPVYYYFCKECNKRINESKLLEGVLFSYEKRLLMNPDVSEDRKRLIKKIIKIEDSIENLEEEYFDDLIDEIYYKKQRTNLLRKRKQSEKALKEMQCEVNDWKNLSRVEQRKIVKRCLKKVMIDFKKETPSKIATVELKE
ncbi:MAG: recombinase family protein [Erysipelotrichaceae bacterium]|nr:recombinase family protein [Erysipelotrichaceae bacterium]